MKEKLKIVELNQKYKFSVRSDLNRTCKQTCSALAQRFQEGSQLSSELQILKKITELS